MNRNVRNSFSGLILLGLLLSGTFPGITFAEVSTNTITEFSSTPINLTGTDVTPLVMLNVSRDHQLSYKAYNDYSDLDHDADKTPETTYADQVDYYGYFDNKKCYTYSTSPDPRFIPAALAVDPNKHHCSGQWSGNFLNWATMTRMDVVRKLLYGGMRATGLDTSTRTVLERHYLPTDAHAFAKYYNGSDIATLTPFSTTVTTPTPVSSITSRTIPTAADTRTFTTTLSVSVGDQIKVFRTGYETTHWMIGGVESTGTGTITINIPAGSYRGGGTTAYNTWTLQNLSQTGITLCNLTKGDNSGTTVNRYSDTNTNLPIIRVAKGNFALWTANEKWQAYWSGEKSNTQSSFTGGFRSNGNKAYLSGLDASAENPSQTTHGLGGTGSAQGEYVARVEACVAAWLGDEKCKQYGSSLKPIGLLQVYGDTNQLNFGLMTGSFAKNISGGVLRKNVATFTNEVNSSNGTFTGTNGIVSNMNKLRLYGYDYNDGTYINHDSCNYQQTGLVLTGGSNAQGSPANQGNCSSWGNPMSEIYLESLRYLAGKTANSACTYAAGTKDAALGLTVATWSSPLNATNYCAPLNILNFNASVSSYDSDLMAGVSDLGTTSTAKVLTDVVGVNEHINTSSWFIGSNGTTSNELCTSKPIGSGFGAFSGLCPEAPTQQGTYLMSGLAHYANTHRIRSDLTIPAARANSRDLKVGTYGIALATNVPKIEVLVNGKKVTILPAYRLDVSSNGTGPFGGGTLVDFKIIAQTPTYGKFYTNWEDSEMGGDYDQDMWGTIEYSVSGDTITITTDAVSASTGNGQGFGYVISGTSKDGAHFHSGIYDFDYTDTTGVTGCNNCVVGNGPTHYDYTATGSSAGVLEDPLYYAAKYGGFTDSNANSLPDLQPEWDKVNNSTGNSGTDDLPDNYFFATDPLQLEDSLNRLFLSMLQRVSSSTAAAVVANNVNGTGALYQAYYEPLRQDSSGKQVSWIGTMQSFWMDSSGYLREDDGDAKLEGYNTDHMIELFYDSAQNKTQVRRYVSAKDNEFAPYYMQGNVTAYDSASGIVTFTVDETSGTSSSGPYSDWTVDNLSKETTGSSTTSATISPLAATRSFTVSPATAWISVGDTIKIAHYESTTIALEQVGTLWNARKLLNQITDTAIGNQRAFTDKADTGRFIKTWFDANGDSLAQASEFICFDKTNVSTANFGYFNLATKAEAENLVDYVRGKEITGYRNRTIDYDGDGATEVQRLGDIVHSSPTINGPPQSSIDLIYRDLSYTVFNEQYANRRNVVYVGSNDGMLHAFNGGFYNATTKSFLVSGKKYDGVTSVVEHPLGSEIWAYVPMNLLPHLKWLKSNSYTHVYYMDGKPRVFDAKIFPKDADHPGLSSDTMGWGTVLVVGMRFGGGAMTIDTAADGLSVGTDNRVFSSAFIIMDITNPEEEPKLLAEIQMPDGSLTTSYPTVMSVKDNDPDHDANKWFLVFGSGPTSIASAENTSAATAKFYSFDLAEIAAPGTHSIAVPPTNCAQKTVGTGGSMKILSCDTGISNSFIGDPVAVDWELDYKADSVYFGIVGNKAATSGRVMRMDIKEEADPQQWVAPATVINTSQPVVTKVIPSIDNNNRKWIFFGTGRFFVNDDQTSTATQSIYGVKDSGSLVVKTDLLNVGAAVVATTGDMTGVTGHSGTAITTFTALEREIETFYDGWYLDLPPIQGAAGTNPATRVISSSSLAGGALFTPAYQPGIDTCSGEGFSRLYGLYYKTGTAFPNKTIFGAVRVNDVEISMPFVELGAGFAADVTLHSGTEMGQDEVVVDVQSSTGAINRIKATTPINIRSSMDSWRERR